jgi:hypothetical protein
LGRKADRVAANLSAGHQNDDFVLGLSWDTVAGYELDIAAFGDGAVNLFAGFREDDI